MTTETQVEFIPQERFDRREFRGSTPMRRVLRRLGEVCDKISSLNRQLRGWGYLNPHYQAELERLGNERHDLEKQANAIVLASSKNFQCMQCRQGVEIEESVTLHELPACQKCGVLMVPMQDNKPHSRRRETTTTGD